ncbi:hypothetical protein [Burkholderia gladioli]|uniref:hypothetical protein n=1 Tax=Burkholderia gladioli TaxID=28095 RepID=UPI00164109D5|nr:hypothetical protein [Burkholderia gladioli]
MSRWQPTEITTLVREVPRAAAPGDLVKFFPRHTLNGIRWKAGRLALAWPRGKRVKRGLPKPLTSAGASSRDTHGAR